MSAPGATVGAVPIAAAERRYTNRAREPTLTVTVCPADLDTAILYDATAVRNPATHAKLARIAANTKSTGLEVHAWLIGWHPEDHDPGLRNAYRGDRGYWDEWWQRDVPKSERNFPQRKHWFPARGYLEVILDGYR